MTRKEEMLKAFDEVWLRKWESLEGYTLKDITEEEALYQHPAYKDEPLEEGHPPTGTVLYLLTHLYDVYRYYTMVVINRPKDVTSPPPPEAHSVAEAVDYIKKFRAELRDVFESLTEEQLEEPVSGDRTVAQLLRMLPRHDSWHTGQIAMLRRLYGARE